MAKIRYVGSQRVSVPLLGRELDPDEIVEIPEDWLVDYAWPDTEWAVVAGAAKRTSRPATTEDGE